MTTSSDNLYRSPASLPVPPAEVTAGGVPDALIAGPHRTLGVWTGLFVVVASMIGTGILTASGYTLRDTGQPVTLLGLWAVGGVLALCGAFCVAELGAALPEAGGDYIYVKRAFGTAAGLVCGWASYALGFVGPTAVMAWTAAAYLLEPFRTRWEAVVPDGRPTAASHWIEVGVAAAIIALLTVGHLFGARRSGAVQGVLTVLKIALLAGYAAAALLLGETHWDHLAQGRPWSAATVPPLAVGLIYVSYAYSGWNGAGYLAGEMRRPERSVPLAVVGGVVSVTVLYLLMNLAYVVALDPTTIADRPEAEIKRVAATAGAELFGPGVATGLSLAFGVSLLASASATLLSGSRIVHAMAVDRFLPPLLLSSPGTGDVSGRTVVAVAIPAMALLTVGTFQHLLNFTAVGLTATSALTIASVFAVRARRLPRPYSMPLFPLPPAIYLTLIAAAIGYEVTLGFNPVPSRLSLVGLAAAFVVAWLVTRARRGLTKDAPDRVAGGV